MFQKEESGRAENQVWRRDKGWEQRGKRKQNMGGNTRHELGAGRRHSK